MTDAGRKLYLNFHGRILDSLGIQMYQSPTAAIAELIANAWDADCEKVSVYLPANLTTGAEIVISDNGAGMTFDECQTRYLKVGANRRQDSGTDKSEKKLRPVLGRKGIGKFAGFGIARVLEIQTTSETTGESTTFEMDLDTLKGTEFVGKTEKVIVVKNYKPPNAAGQKDHGTKITLKSLNVKRAISEQQMLRSMARRFLMHQGATDFSITINDKPLPGSETDLKAEFIFPSAYEADEIPAGLTIDSDGWGTEQVGGKTIKWRFVFSELPIEHEELRGISIFCRGKIAQAPFIFNLSGGLGGQHGLE